MMRNGFALGNSGRLLLVLLILWFGFAGLLQADEPPLPPETAATPTPEQRARVQTAMNRMPLYFVENRGQVDGLVDYYLLGGQTQVALSAEGLTLVQTEAPAPEAKPEPGLRPVSLEAERPAARRWALQLRFIEAATVRPQGRLPSEACVNYFKGPQEQWKTGVLTFEEVVYPELWPGVDLVYRGTGGQMKSTFYVQPGADPARIQLAYAGATGVTVTDAGTLRVETPVAAFEEAAPVVYQEINGEQRPVSAHYQVEKTAAGDWRYRFALGDYDTRHPLIIDPVVLSYAGFIGGTNYDYGYGIAVDGSGAAYVTGYTSSTQTSFPIRLGPDLTANGSTDAFVAKVALATNTFTVTPSAGAGGSINPNTPQVIIAGQPTTFTITPNTGYGIQSVTGTCGGTLSGNTYTTRSITTNCTVIANFGLLYTVTATAGPNGAISPASQTIVAGKTATVTVTPANAGYGVQAITGCGSGTPLGNTYTTGPITANCTVRATFGTAYNQAIIGTAGGSEQALVYPLPGGGLPAPTAIAVPGIVSPHGVGYYGADNALVSNFGAYKVSVVQISTASLVDTIDTAAAGYDGTGTIAIAPSLTYALASGNSPTLFRITAPFVARATITSVPLTGSIRTWQTQAIVFAPSGRAYVYTTAGINVLDPPYDRVAFVIPVTGNSSGAIAITPNGGQLLVTNLSSADIQIFTAPYSATSTAVRTALPGASGPDGIMVTPNGSKALVVSAGAPRVHAVSAPFSATSTVEAIPLPATISGGFEDVGISADGQLAILTGNSGGSTAPFIKAPFTAAGATVYAVAIPGGRGAGAVRFLPPGLAAGLTVNKTGPASAVSGTNITYTINYANTGGAAATGVILKDTIPSGATFVSATGGGTLTAGVVSWPVGNLAAGASGSVQLTVTINAPSGSVTNGVYTIQGTGVAPIFGPPVITTVTPGFLLTVSRTGSGSGTVTGPGINCGVTCKAAYPTGTSVTLRAAPATGSTFAGWSGACAGGNCIVTMSAARQVTAIFNRFDPTAVTALSITRRDWNPTGAASVAWTALFSGPITGLKASNFALVAGAGVTGAGITGVNGSGTTWTVTAATGTGNGTLGLNLVNTTGVTPPIANLLTGEVYRVAKTPPTGGSNFGIVWSGEQLVEVGAGGTIFTSLDGITWTSRSSGTTQSLAAVAWSGQRLVAVGGVGTILTSPDGVNWTRVIPAPTTKNLSGVAWSGSQFVAVGDQGAVLTSPTGQTWTDRTATSGTTANLADVTWAGSQWVVVGSGGAIRTSLDGINWTARSSGTPANFSGIAWSGNQLVAVGSSGAIRTSPDGVTWTSRTSGTSQPLFSIAWSGYQFMATGAGGVILTSRDGSAWTTQTAGTTQNLLGIAWTGDRFVAVGANNTRITLARPWGDLKPLIPYRWTMLGLPAISRTPTAAQAFAGLDPASYPDQWSVYDYDLATKQYRELPPTAVLSQDIGYWLIDQGSVAHTVQLNPPATATVVFNNPRCPSTGGCYEVPLSPPGVTDAYLYNLVGMPLPYPVGWWDVRLEVNGTAYTLDAAQTAGYVEKNYWVWNGNDYNTYDSRTLGSAGVLQPWQGIWVKVWAASRGKTLKLLIPRIPKYSHIPPPAPRVEEGDGWLRALDWLMAPAAAAGTPTTNPRSWYVRLVAEEASQNLLARNSVLGQLPDSVDGYDAHDLPKLPPFGAPYLSVAFPHPDWGQQAGDYASDYRSNSSSGGAHTTATTTAGPAKPPGLPPATWRFEVRTDRAGYAIKLRWEGPPDLLGRMELVDNDTGRRYPASDPGYVRNGIPVTMTAPVRHFTWVFAGQPAL